MNKRATTSYQLLLAAMLALAVVLCGTGESQARYANTATWNTFVQPLEEETLSSDWLQPIDAEQTTILFGELTQAQEEITFTLRSTQDMTGKLEWSTDLPEYLNVTCQSDAALTLTKDQPVTVVLTVQPTELALNTVREEVMAHVTVTWNDAMSGRFRLVLPAVSEQQEQETAEEDMPEQEPLQPAVMAVDTVAHFEADGVLPVKVTASAGVTRVQLGLNDGQTQSLQPFPARTQYRLNGETYMLYRDSVIGMEVLQETLAVQMDFSQTAFAPGRELCLMAEGLGDSVLPGTAMAQTVADVACIVPEQQPVLTDKGTVELVLPAQWKELPVSYAVERLVLQERETAEKAYVPVEDLESGELQVRLADDPDGYRLVLKTGDTLPAAGTYRICWKWNYEGMDFGENRTYFFINYLPQTEQMGGAEQ